MLDVVLIFESYTVQLSKSDERIFESCTVHSDISDERIFESCTVQRLNVASRLLEQLK